MEGGEQAGILHLGAKHNPFSNGKNREKDLSSQCQQPSDIKNKVAVFRLPQVVGI